jgi:hypothetical protein
MATICPRCKYRFEAKDNRTYPGLLRDLFSHIFKPFYFESPIAQVDKATEVKCPNCGNVFPCEEIKLFGFLSPSKTKTILIIYIATFVLLGLLFLFIN